MHSHISVPTGSKLAAEEVFGGLDEDVAGDVVDGFSAWALLGAGLDAVLSEAAFLDAGVTSLRWCGSRLAWWRG